MRKLLTPIIAVVVTLAIVWSSPVRLQSKSGAANSFGQNSNITQIARVSVNNDPCGSWGATKLSAVVTVAATSTIQIIAGVAGQTIFVCGYQVTQTTAIGTVQWTSGTGGACGAAIVTLTGAMPTNAGTPLTYGGGEMSIMAAAAGSGVCLTTAGGGTHTAGVITYVQRVAGT